MVSERRYIEFRGALDARRSNVDGTVSLVEVTLEGRTHLVVPVIALIGDTVVHASNAPTPEYIPLTTLESSRGWNGRPIVASHPRNADGTHISANSPTIFDSMRMGSMFNKRVEDGKLKADAYLDTTRCEELGGDSLLALEKLRAGEIVNVSIGGHVEIQKSTGVSLSGDEYGAVWTDLEGDHLAILPRTNGACSLEMGCGANRVMAVHTNSNSLITYLAEVPMVEAETKPDALTAPAPQSFLSRLLAKFRPAAIFDGGDSVDDLRRALADATRKVDKALDWICDVYPDSGMYIYATYMSLGYGSDSRYQYWLRAYAIDGSGLLTVGAEVVEEVFPRQIWETKEGTTVVRAAQANNSEAITVADCNCQKGELTVANPTTQLTAQQPTQPPTICAARAAAIDQLIVSGRFAEADRKPLEALSEAGFKALSAPVPPPAPEASATPVASITAAAATAANPLTLVTEDQVLAAFPSLAAVVNSHRAASESRRTSLIDRLAEAPSVISAGITREQLAARSLEQLEETAKLTGLANVNLPVDFSVRGLALGMEPPKAVEAPDGYMLALQKRQQAN